MKTIKEMNLIYETKSRPIIVRNGKLVGFLPEGC